MKRQVYELMSYPVVTIQPEAKLKAAEALMVLEGVRQLPVLTADKQLIGIISDRDLRKMTQAMEDDRAIVRGAMTTPVLTVRPDVSAARAAHILKTEKIGALPVVENDELIGIITTSDILDAFSTDGWQSSASLSPL